MAPGAHRTRARRGTRIAAARRAAAACLLGAAAACATGSSYRQMAAKLAPPAEGMSRIFVYLTTSSGAPAFWPQIAIDGELVGELRTGSFFYVDRPAGVHQVSVLVRTGTAAFGNQGATEPVSVLVAPGGAAYVQVQVTVGASMLNVTLLPEDAADAQRDLGPLDYAAPAPAP
jgi:hypothetical protein